MESPNNRGILTRPLLLPNETSNAGGELDLIELLVNGDMWKPPPPTTQVIAKGIGCPPQTDDKELLLKTLPV